MPLPKKMCGLYKCTKLTEVILCLLFPQKYQDGKYQDEQHCLSIRYVDVEFSP